MQCRIGLGRWPIYRKHCRRPWARRQQSLLIRGGDRPTDVPKKPKISYSAVSESIWPAKRPDIFPIPAHARGDTREPRAVMQRAAARNIWGRKVTGALTCEAHVWTKNERRSEGRRAWIAISSRQHLLGQRLQKKSPFRAHAPKRRLALPALHCRCRCCCCQMH